MFVSTDVLKQLDRLMLQERGRDKSRHSCIYTKSFIVRTNKIL